MGLAVVLALLGLRLLPLPALLVGTLAGSFKAGLLPAVWHTLAVAVGGSLIGAAWVHRRRLLEPLGVAATELDESATVPLWASQRILGTMAVAVLMAVTAHVAVQVVLVFAALFGFLALFAWPTLLTLVGGMALAWWLWRGRVSATSADAGPPSPRQRGVAVLFLVLSGAAFLASAASSGGGIRYSHLDVLLAVTGVALLTRSRAWRTAALVINSLLASLGAAQVLALLFLLTRGESAAVASIGGSVGLGTAFVLAVFKTLAFVAGLWVLCRAEGWPAHEQRPLPPLAPATTDPGTVPFCRSAVWSALLVGISLGLVLIGLGLVALGASSLPSPRTGALPKINLLLLALLALPVLATAITGTVLGVVGWREIGRSGGRLRGKAFAVVGALTWPVSVVLLGPLLLLSIGYFTLRVEAPMVSPVVRYEGAVAVGQGVVRAYQIPAGQAALFEVVTQDGASVVALPGYATYALAPATGPAEATVHLELGLPDGAANGEGRWQFKVTYGGSSALVGGLVLPETVMAPLPPASAAVSLEPESERLEWIVPRDDHTAALGLRARTSPHGLTGIEPGGPRSYGVGTNWLGNATIGGGK